MKLRCCSLIISLLFLITCKSPTDIKDNLTESHEKRSLFNGHKMVYLKDQKIGDATGQIALQIHDGGGIKVRWENITFTPL